MAQMQRAGLPSHMRNQLLFLLFSAGACIAQAQNLVVNGSFEEVSNCPSTLGEVDRAVGWSGYRGSCDYFNSCDLDTVGVPSNWLGYQPAATGNGYCGIYCFSEDDGNPLQAREWLGSSLQQALTVGTRYFFSMKVCLTTGGFGTHGSFIYAVDHLGMLLLNSSISQTDADPVPNRATIYAINVVTDSTNWTLVSGSFVADSGYTNIAVGNFFDDATTNAIAVVPNGLYQYAYYYIDDVCLSADPGACGIMTNVSEGAQENVTVSPNPFYDSIRLNWSPATSGAQSIDLFDLFGRTIPVFLSMGPSSAEVRLKQQSAMDQCIIKVVLKDGSQLTKRLLHISP